MIQHSLYPKNADPVLKSILKPHHFAGRSIDNGRPLFLWSIQALFTTHSLDLTCSILRLLKPLQLAVKVRTAPCEWTRMWCNYTSASRGIIMALPGE